MVGINAARGEVGVILNGQACRMCLTLGALAQIEAILGVSHFTDIGSRLKNVGGDEVKAVASALLRGGGEPDARLANASIDELKEAVEVTFRAACQ